MSSYIQVQPRLFQILLCYVVRAFGSKQTTNINQAYPINATVVLNNELYIFYYDFQSGDLSYLVSNLGNDSIKYTRRSSITTTKGRYRGPIRGNTENRTIHPLAAAADPASGTVWVYYTDVQGMVNNAFTKDGGSTWTSGDVIDAQIKLLGNFTISVYFDPKFSEPRIVFSDLHDECLAYSYNDDGSWRNEYVGV